MSKSISEEPSRLQRQQIQNLTALIRDLIARTFVHPLNKKKELSRIEHEFHSIEEDARLACDVQDSASGHSFGSEDRAQATTNRLLAKLVRLKNEAMELIANEGSEGFRDRNDLSGVLDALEEIRAKHKVLLNSDQNLKNDFSLLAQCIRVSKPLALQRCNTIIRHLIEEVKEGAGDDQRLADESPICVTDNSEACRHLEEHQSLREELEIFYKSYLKR
jgi:hypothetical protein